MAWPADLQSRWGRHRAPPRASREPEGRHPDPKPDPPSRLAWHPQVSNRRHLVVQQAYCWQLLDTHAQESEERLAHARVEHSGRQRLCQRWAAARAECDQLVRHKLRQLEEQGRRQVLVLQGHGWQGVCLFAQERAERIAHVQAEGEGLQWLHQRWAATKAECAVLEQQKLQELEEDGRWRVVWQQAHGWGQVSLQARERAERLAVVQAELDARRGLRQRWTTAQVERNAIQRQKLVGLEDVGRRRVMVLQAQDWQGVRVQEQESEDRCVFVRCRPLLSGNRPPQRPRKQSLCGLQFRAHLTRFIFAPRTSCLMSVAQWVGWRGSARTLQTGVLVSKKVAGCATRPVSHYVKGQS